MMQEVISLGCEPGTGKLHLQRRASEGVIVPFGGF